MKRAIFLDRDGTLMVDKDYLSDPDEVEVYPGVARALQRLQKAGFVLFIVTNQSGIGRGYFSEAQMQRVHDRIFQELAPFGVTFTKVYFAPETPDQPSRGRKPSPQFLFDARDEFGIDLAESYFIGDKLIDLECGWNAGVKESLLVRTGYGRDSEKHIRPGMRTSVVDNLDAAADLILAKEAHSGKTPENEQILGLIPARYASSRFPGKPLALIAGRPLIQHVVERCRQAKSLHEVIVATDDMQIAKVVQPFCRVEMTRSDHASGSDRIAEVVGRFQCRAVVNIQGDEPLIDPEVINAVAEALESHVMSTAATLIKDPAEYENPNVVKVVVSRAKEALYFSRRTIPCIRDAADDSIVKQLAAFPFLKHLGIYGYRRETLLRLVSLPISELERAERLEQLRALENGIRIGVVQVDHDSVGVDVPGDIERVERLLRG